MPNLKFDFSRHICTADQRLVNSPPLGGAPSPYSLTYLSKPAPGDIGTRRLPPRQPLVILVRVVVSNYRSLLSYDYFDKLLRLENVVIFKTRRFFQEDSVYS